MKWIFHRFFPRFCTIYFAILDNPFEPSSPFKMLVRLQGPTECIPGYRYIRFSFFNCFGIPLFRKAERFTPTH